MATTFVFDLKGSGEYFVRAPEVKVHYRRKSYAGNHYRSNFGLKRRREFWLQPKCGENYLVKLLCLNLEGQVNIFCKILRLNLFQHKIV